MVHYWFLLYVAFNFKYRVTQNRSSVLARRAVMPDWFLRVKTKPLSKLLQVMTTS